MIPTLLFGARGTILIVQNPLRISYVTYGSLVTNWWLL